MILISIQGLNALANQRYLFVTVSYMTNVDFGMFVPRDVKFQLLNRSKSSPAMKPSYSNEITNKISVKISKKKFCNQYFRLNIE